MERVLVEFVLRVPLTSNVLLVQHGSLSGQMVCKTFKKHLAKPFLRSDAPDGIKSLSLDI